MRRSSNQHNEIELFGNRAHNQQLQLHEVQEPAILTNARPGIRDESMIAIERRVEELAEMTGAFGSALNELLVINTQGQEMNLDRFSQLKSQITRENQKLMHAIARIRQESRCNLSDPRTYAYCIKLIYHLIFNIFYLLCQLIFIVGGSINNFLFYIPLTGGILIILGIAFQALLFFLLFDATVYVSTLSLSHAEVFNHDLFFQHLNGGEQMVGANMLLYEGLIMFLIRTTQTVVNVIVTGHRLFLGRITDRLFRIMQREIGNPKTIVGSIVEDVMDTGKEKVTEFIKDSINHQIEDLSIIPNQVTRMADQGASLAGRGVAGVSTLAEQGASLAGRGVAGVSTLASQGASLAGRGVSTLASQGASLASQGASLASQGASLAGRRMEDLRNSGIIEGLEQRAENIKHGIGSFASRFTSRYSGGAKRRTKKQRRLPLPKFSILTKKEQKEFDKTIAGKKLKQLKQIIDTIDYRSIQINPRIFYMTQFVLNLTENLFPIFVKDLDTSVKLCKLIKKENMEGIMHNHNRMLEQIIDVATL